MPRERESLEPGQQINAVLSGDLMLQIVNDEDNNCLRVYSQKSLVVLPKAGNCVYITTEKRPEK